VIAVTASVMDRDRRKILAAGFDGYQAKPIEVTQFVAAVRQAVDGPASSTRAGTTGTP
jgi:CheY-like chemotaxis protein